MIEVETLRKMGAFTEIAADDPKIKGWRVVDTMWTGRVKRKADRTVDKRKGRKSREHRGSAPSLSQSSLTSAHGSTSSSVSVFSVPEI